ncbi:MAG: pyridoxal phosphate-dependent aminotransferase [Pseudomonadota bacterium]|nr:pyridoxal phosphate-dependent aminotransferase [Pseudomonadota bacterium]
MELSQRVLAIKPSPTLAVTSRAAQLKSQGHDIISLGAGEPDFDTPAHIKLAAIEAINKGYTKYTDVGGTPALKNAVTNKFRRENNVRYETRQVLISCGGKQSFFNLIQALINPGDEAIIPAPYWVSYPDIVILAGGTPVFIEAGIKQSFKITPEQLESKITPRTRLMVINSPCNPSGAVYSLEELKALGAVLAQHPEIVIASDDMYEHVNLSGQPFVNILNACPKLYERTLLLNGVSKAYAMTGWRIGYAAGPEQIITAMTNVQSQSTSNPCSISQVAAHAALEGPQDCIAPMIEAFKARHSFVVNALNTIKGVFCLESGGAFYAFPDVHEVINQLYKEKRLAEANDIAFSEFLLEKAEVAVVPGSAFGMEGYIRLSFATSMTNLEKALSRISKILS